MNRREALAGAVAAAGAVGPIAWLGQSTVLRQAVDLRVQDLPDGITQGRFLWRSIPIPDRGRVLRVLAWPTTQLYPEQPDPGHPGMVDLTALQPPAGVVFPDLGLALFAPTRTWVCYADEWTGNTWLKSPAEVDYVFAA